MRSVLHVIGRKLVWIATFFLPRSARIARERRLRGREEARKLKHADGVIASYGKSGRTWLRVMVSRFYQVRYKLPDSLLMGFDNFHRKNPATPKLLFTHDNYLRDYTGNRGSKVDYKGLPVVFLARHPADTAVSQFFQWKFRMKPHKRLINDYPKDLEMPIFDFVMSKEAGIPKVIDYLNGWAEAKPLLGERLHIVRYEDLRQFTAEALGGVLTHLGADPSAEDLAEAVDFASFENMRKMEASKSFRGAGSRMKAKDKSNPNSFKVRRGKVGGFRDYFDDDQVKEIEAFIDVHLNPVFGYTHVAEKEDSATHEA